MDNKNITNITQILQNALSSDKTTRVEAEKMLEQLALGNFPEFLYKLATELSDESKPPKIRQMAATFIKNSIVYVDSLKEIWVNKLDSQVKDQIKMFVLATLASELKEIRAAAGLVIAGICKVDLPLNDKWPGLIQSLCQNAFQTNLNLRLAAIESLGYVCEELTPKTIDPGSVDNILSALIQNLKSDSVNEEVTRTLLKAFYHTIKLAHKNFSRPVKYIYIFRMNSNLLWSQFS
jgi:importin subunit beta-1